MKIKILNENENKLFHRKEVSFNANHDSESTPTKSTIYTYFSAKFKSPKTNFLSEISSILANMYINLSS